MRLKTLFIAYVLNFSSKAVDIIFFLIMVRMIEKEEIGLYSSIMSFSAILYVFLNGGLVEAAIREYVSDENTATRKIKRGVASRIYLVFLIVLVVYALSNLTNIKYTDNKENIYWAIAFQALMVLQGIYQAKLKGTNRQNIANAMTLCDAMLKLCGLIIFSCIAGSILAVNIWQITVLAKSITLLWALFNGFQIPIYSDLVPSGDARYILFKEQRYFIMTSLLNILQNRFDWILISVVLTQEAVASYAVANKFYEIIQFIAGIGATTIYPWLFSNKINNDKKDSAKKIENLLNIQIPLVTIVIASILFGFDSFNELFWDGKYKEVNSLIKYFLPCIILAVRNMNLYYYCMAEKRDRHVLIISITSTTIQVVFNLFAIRGYGINGAIMGMWILNIINLILYTIILGKTTNKANVGILRESALTVCLAIVVLSVSVVLSEYYSFFILSMISLIILLWSSKKYRLSGVA